MKARIKNKIVLFLQIVFTACFVILNSGCGLDEYYVLEEPNAVNVPVEESVDGTPLVQYAARYFEFNTNENSDYNNSGFDFTGTDVYYKLYSYYSTCSQEYNALKTLLNSSSTKANSASSLINTYKFQKLKILNSSNDVTIPHDETKNSQNVRIRLTSYLEVPTDEDFVASVRVDGSDKGVPVRYYDNRFFDFHRNNDVSYKAPLPRSTSYEDDVSSNTSISVDGWWYITLFAVAVGHDSSFTTYYSPITYLGTIRIDATSYDN